MNDNEKEELKNAFHLYMCSHFMRPDAFVYCKKKYQKQIIIAGGGGEKLLLFFFSFRATQRICMGLQKKKTNYMNITNLVQL